MSETANENDLVDRIAAALPAEIRAEYYREFLHCRAQQQDRESLFGSRTARDGA